MKLSLIGALGLVVSIAGCAATDEGAEPEPQSSSDEIVASVMANTAKVEADRLIFPKSAITPNLRDRITKFRQAIDSGKNQEETENVILLGDRGKDAVDANGQVKEDVANPYGYIRRAVSFRDEGDKTIIMTEEATLEEALSQLDEEQLIQIGGEAQTAPGQVTPQVNLKKKLNFKIPILKLDDKELFRKDEAVLKIKQGGVRIDTTLDLGINIGLFKVNHVHAAVDADLQSDLILEATASKAFDASPQKQVFRGNWAVGAIGPVPITLQLSASIGCDLHAEGHVTVTGGVKTSLEMKAGLSFDRGQGVKPMFERPSFTPTVVKPTVDARANGSVKCFVRPEVALLFAGVGGPMVIPTLYGKVEATVPPLKAELVGGVTVDVGGKLSVFGKNLGSIQKEVFKVERPLWHN